MLLKVVNSPFFLWCLSAVFLTIGAGYLTNHQQCVRDADKLSLDYFEVTEELYSRRVAIVDAINEAETIDEARSALARRPYWILQGRTFSQLIYQLASFQIDRSALTPNTVNVPDPVYSSTQAKYFDFFQDGIIGPTLTNTDLAELKKLAEEMGHQWAAQHVNNLLHFERNCSIANLVSLALGYRPYIVKATRINIDSKHSNR
jgi:hypothetical protein